MIIIIKIPTISTVITISHNGNDLGLSVVVFSELVFVGVMVEVIGELVSIS
jgi:hypothetical protein